MWTNGYTNRVIFVFVWPQGYKYHDSSVLLICLLFVTTVVPEISLLYLFIHIWNSQNKVNRIGGVMISVVVSFALDRVFVALYASFSGHIKHRLARNQDDDDDAWYLFL
jgi:hypothetical protein